MTPASKTFKVSGTNGSLSLEAQQLATFAHYINQQQFRFVVTQLPNEATPSLTHRASGLRVTKISLTAIQAARGDYKVAAVSELKRVIEHVGEARLASSLRKAEA
ncbi:hypothetical protein K6Y74_38655 [Burkholderia cenocepacia]|uniref:hypothetical protein n=1 Tax=Burkholderia cenocepacia TaxID=95486 RepID=UPI00223256B3|nr:hypothetical protein [Burkholderia cenocepacia]MCW3649140.1 hypothetical protein [Burkholderia cenocepacia]